MEESKQILEDVHEGECRNQAGGRALAIKIKRQGYFWPTMLADCEAHSRRCDQCQRHAPNIKRPAEELSSISAPYPFMKWSMDIVGPMPVAPGGLRFLLILTDYFSKWVETGAFVLIKDVDVTAFIWKNIICRHGTLHEIITDNGSQFISKKFRKFCFHNNIEVRMSTPRYPQGNGHAEATNKTIVDSIRKRLDAKKGRWAEELPGVLWVYRTSPRRPTGETPFSLVHGVESLIPIEHQVQTLRVKYAPEDEPKNDEALCDALDLVEEKRDSALSQLSRYRQSIARFYNKDVNTRRFDVGDLVLRKIFQNTAEANAGKLGAKWEGPYRVTRVTYPGVYELETLNGIPVLRSWNVSNLKKYYY